MVGNSRRRLWLVAALAGVAPALTVFGWSPAGVAQSGGQQLIGTFKISAGSCEGGTPTGSTFRMVLPNGNAGGPYVSNNDSTCSDRTYTLLAPGADGGLVTGAHQPGPSPAFDSNGNGLASRITKPARFYGVAFATSTNPKDPQTGATVGAPAITSQPDGKLTGDLRAFAASWNRQEFNQGAPKPDGSTPGNTALPSGTYNPSTGAFTLNWASQIQGGPFDRFTGVWHLEGTFVAGGAGSASSPGDGSSPGTGGGGGGGGQPSGGASSGGSSSRTSGQASAAERTAVAGAPATTVAGSTEADAAVVEMTDPVDGSASETNAGAGEGDRSTTASPRRTNGGDGRGVPAGFAVVAAALVIGAVAALVVVGRSVRRQGWRA